MEQDTQVLNYAIDSTIDHIFHDMMAVPDMEIVARKLAERHPSMVDSLTTGMIQTRLKEFRDGR